MSGSGIGLPSGNAATATANTSLLLPALPQSILEDIINRLEDAESIARAQSVCREWNDAGNNVKSLRIVCLDKHHKRAREDPTFEGKCFRCFTSDGAGSSTSSSPQSAEKFISFKALIVKILRRKHNIVQLRIEVEAQLQSKPVLEAERRRTDFWLTDQYFLMKWLPRIGATLQHLCIVDYGQQAIMRRSKIVKILSENCKLLKTLDLRNLFIDTSDCDLMPSMSSVTLRCVKVVGDTLQHLNAIMPNLLTLALLKVFGAEGGFLKFQFLKVLCLGLSTSAKEVVMDCPVLEKLQLKMLCPEKLIITAMSLKYVAFNLDVLEQSKVELRSMVGLRELLYGAASFVTLSLLVEKNYKNLEKLFLDIPCMALAEDGRFLGVLKDTPLHLPSFSKLHECRKLEVLNIGPGLFHSMETQVPAVLRMEKRPTMRKLIIQIIPHDIDATILVLQALLQPSVTSLVVYIHKSSPMTQELLAPRIEEIVSGCEQSIDLEIYSWQKSLDFSCFSF